MSPNFFPKDVLEISKVVLTCRSSGFVKVFHFFFFGLWMLFHSSSVPDYFQRNVLLFVQFLNLKMNQCCGDAYKQLI